MSFIPFSFKKAQSLSLAMIICLALFVTLFSSCGCGGETSADATMEETEEPESPTVVEETIIMVVERPKAQATHKAKAKAVEAQPEQFKQVKEEDVVIAPAKEKNKAVIMTPHKTTYVPVPMLEEAGLHEVNMAANATETKVKKVNIAEIARKLTEYDTPPIYDEDCADKKHVEHCSHMSLQRFFNRNIDYSLHPDDPEDHVEYATFIVKADGTVDASSITVVDQSPHCEECAVETKRVVALLDDWKPGTWNGQPVDVQVTLPVRFHDFELDM